MAIEKVREYFKKYNIEKRIIEFNQTSATVTDAAIALNTTENRIAKTMAFKLNNKYILIVTSGDMKIDNSKYRHLFKEKAKMLTEDELTKYIGHPKGGVCPFAVNDNVECYLDVSLKRFLTVYPACGSSNSAIEFTIQELEKYSNYNEWIDVCKIKGE